MGKYSSKKDEWFDYHVNEGYLLEGTTKRDWRKARKRWKQERTRYDRRLKKKHLRDAVLEMENRR